MQRLSVLGHRIRILDSGEKCGTPVLFAADAPVVLEHYLQPLSTLSRRRRAIAIELPGFGFSVPAKTYRFTLEEQVKVILDG